eukprot:TRINITY_DN75597_c0_g1_i1.p1 TRINITY_DN75597_c0_g1~~TRINITY_DN75597_c0_g1_i1.p1  ORF type:complete len:392 (-),score=76.47 TRINITY_DN75597_c0_g1_i1:42-1115(-)
MDAVALQARNDAADSSSEDLTLGPEDDKEQECGEDEGGPYATLASLGAMESAGSVEHPNNCQPCTFYCFTRRGCNRGADCKFCHMSHQSKLQQRREAWKKQQREKRKSIRERVVLETTMRQKSKDDIMMSGGGGAGGGGETQAIRLRLEAATAKPSQQMRPAMGKGLGRALGQPQVGPCLQHDASGGLSSSLVFAYTPQRSTFTMGQFAEIVPALFGCTAVRQFSLHAPLPKGLSLDPASGVISGSPLLACRCTSVFVEVEMIDGRRAQTSLEIEVVDFTRGGFVVGHISEVEPGRFMLLLYKPEDNDADGRPSYEQRDLMSAGQGPHKKMGDFSEAGGRPMAGGQRGRNNTLQGDF